MAIAYATVARYPDRYNVITDITCDGAYAAGGYALTASQLGVLSIDGADAESVTGDGFTPCYVASTGKLKIFKSAAVAGQHTEAVAADLSTANKFRLTVTGKAIV